MKIDYINLYFFNQVTKYDGNKHAKYEQKTGVRSSRPIHSSNRIPRLQNLDSSSLSGLFTKRRNVNIAEKLKNGASQQPIEAYRVNVKQNGHAQQDTLHVRNKHLFSILSSRPKLDTGKAASGELSSSLNSSLSASMYSSVPIGGGGVARIRSNGGSCNLDDDPLSISSNSSSFRQAATVSNSETASLNNSASIASNDESNGKLPSNLTSIQANSGDYVITRL
jgi:hypothetical protein